MSLLGLFANRVLIAGLIAWLLAQSLKVPLYYMQHRRFNWALLVSAGGMPSSHSSLVTSTALAIGLYEGFDTSLFALAIAVAMIVIYDATGIRRQAGMHAHSINLLVEELFQGKPIDNQQLKEVLGHTPMEALGGIVLGVLIALLVWFFWH
jgi:acid phosphatase family membrane protein YuiD